MTSGSEPRVSFVVTSRNDDHGGKLIQRMQLFVNGLIEQCQRHELQAELVWVEWNPPEQRPRIKDAIKWPEQRAYCPVRIIEVPLKLHQRYEHWQGLPLFQMIAKNVGIRRSRGKFVIATNIDILIPDDVFAFLKSDRVQDHVIYRVDRFDVPEDVPGEKSLDDQFEYCRQNVIRKQLRQGTLDCRTGQWAHQKFTLWQRTRKLVVRFLYLILSLVTNAFRYILPASLDRRIPTREPLSRRLRGLHIRYYLRVLGRGFKSLFFWHRIPIRGPGLHTNACGDFTLAARSDWNVLRGYAEFEMYSLHIDSLFCISAAHYGFGERMIPGKSEIFHIEHGSGSGWTPEGVDKLNQRLVAAKVKQLPYKQLVQMDHDMATGRRSPIFNDANWGLAGENLPEMVVE